MALDNVVLEKLQQKRKSGFNVDDTLSHFGISFGGEGEFSSWTNQSDVINYEGKQYFLKSLSWPGNIIIGIGRPVVEYFFNDGFVQKASFIERVKLEQEKFKALREVGVNVPVACNDLLSDELANQVSLTKYVDHTNLLKVGENDLVLPLLRAFEEYRKLHDAGFVHGDAWLGNIGEEPGSGDIILFDGEFKADNLPHKDLVGLCCSVLARTNKNTYDVKDMVKDAYGILPDSMKQAIKQDVYSVEQSRIPLSVRSRFFDGFVYGTSARQTQCMREMLLE